MNHQVLHDSEIIFEYSRINQEIESLTSLLYSGIGSFQKEQVKLLLATYRKTRSNSLTEITRRDLVELV